MNYVVGHHFHNKKLSGSLSYRGDGLSDNIYEYQGFNELDKKAFGKILPSMIDIENDEDYGTCIYTVIHGAKHYYPVTRKVKKGTVLNCKKIKWSDDKEHRLVEKRQFEVIKFPSHLNHKITQLLNQ